MKGKHIKGNVCTATHLHPPFLSSFFEIILHLLLFATERLWKSISISALYRCIMWWWSCYICINVQFSSKVFKFLSLLLQPVPLFYMHMHHKYTDTNQLLLFLGSGPYSYSTQHSHLWPLQVFYFKSLHSPSHTHSLTGGHTIAGSCVWL